MAKNDRRDDEARGGLGTMTRTRPGPRPGAGQDQAPGPGAGAGADVAAPAPRRGRQARQVPPQRALDAQQAAPVRRPAAEPYAPGPRTADRRGDGRTARRPVPGQPVPGQPVPGQPVPGQPGADPRRADPRRAGQRGSRQPGAEPWRGDQPGADPRRGDQRGFRQRLRGPREATALDRQGATSLNRQGAPARTGPRPADQAGSPGAPWRVAPERRGTEPQPASQSAPRRARGAGGQQADTAEREPRAFLPGQPDQAPPGAELPAPAATAVQTILGSHRMPFVLLLCGLLGGALVSALVISTTLAAGSFQITRLQESTASLAKQRQALEQQVAQAKSPEVIAERASKLGMRRAGLIQFIDLKTGKTLNDAASGWLAHVQYPGYTP